MRGLDKMTAEEKKWVDDWDMQELLGMENDENEEWLGLFTDDLRFPIGESERLLDVDNLSFEDKTDYWLEDAIRLLCEDLGYPIVIHDIRKSHVNPDDTYEWLIEKI